MSIRNAGDSCKVGTAHHPIRAGAPVGSARPTKIAAFVLVVLIILSSARRAGANEGPEPSLSLADLASYRAALEKASEGSAKAVPVTFRELWGHAERYQGRRVRVEGRVVRRFRQGAVGTFPPLSEVWAVSPAGDPFCLVFPASAAPDTALGAWVWFEGMFLRRLRYQGADTARLAPLIVGDRAPTVTTPAPQKSTRDPGPPVGVLSGVDWTLGLVVAALIALVLARRHLTARARRPIRSEREHGSPPEFIEQAS